MDRETIESARHAFATYLENQYGSEAARDRADGIYAGREDGEEFIAGYLAAAADAA